MGKGILVQGAQDRGPLPGMTRPAPALTRGKSFRRRGGGTRRRAAAGAAHGWGMGGAARRKNGPLPGGKRGGRARRQMRRGGPAVRQRVCRPGGGRDGSRWGTGGASRCKTVRCRAALRCGKCAADGLPCGMGQMGFACESGASRRKNGLLPGGLAMRQMRCGRPAVRQRVCRPGGGRDGSRWGTGGASRCKTVRCRAALRCGKCAADGLPCGMGQMGFACESGASRRKNGLLPGGLAMRQTRCGRPAVWQRVRLWERLPGAVSGKRGRFSATGRGRAGADRSQAAQRQQRVGDIKMGRARTTGPATGHFSFSSTRAFASAITDGSGRWMPVSGSQCSLTTSRLVA